MKPRRQANVNQADVQRMIRAYKREGVPFRIILQPNGAAVFEPPKAGIEEIESETRDSSDEVNHHDCL